MLRIILTNLKGHTNIFQKKVLKLEIDIFFLRVLNKLGIVKF